MNFNEISSQRWKLFRVSSCPSCFPLSLFFLSLLLLFSRTHARLLVLFVLIYALYVLLDIRQACFLSQLFRERATRELVFWSLTKNSKHRNSNYIHGPIRTDYRNESNTRNVNKITHTWLTSRNNHKYRGTGESKRKIVLNRTVVSWFGPIVSNDWLNVVFPFNSVRSFAIKPLRRFSIDRLMTD